MKSKWRRLKRERERERETGENGFSYSLWLQCDLSSHFWVDRKESTQWKRRRILSILAFMRQTLHTKSHSLWKVSSLESNNFSVLLDSTGSRVTETQDNLEKKHFRFSALISFCLDKQSSMTEKLSFSLQIWSSFEKKSNVIRVLCLRCLLLFLFFEEFFDLRI